MNAPVFMSWLDRLPEVGAPILNERDRLEAMLAEAEAFERRAAELRASARAGRAGSKPRACRYSFWRFSNRWFPGLKPSGRKNAARMANAACFGVMDPDFIDMPYDAFEPTQPLNRLGIARCAPARSNHLSRQHFSSAPTLRPSGP